jgi:hypothetical protein
LQLKEVGGGGVESIANDNIKNVVFFTYLVPWLTFFLGEEKEARCFLDGGSFEPYCTAGPCGRTYACFPEMEVTEVIWRKSQDFVIRRVTGMGFFLGYRFLNP